MRMRAKRMQSRSSSICCVTGAFRRDWYERHLGVRQVGKEYEDGSWWQDEGPTVFGAESQETQVGGSGRAWRINFRVSDLDAMVAQLRTASISVEIDSAIHPNGRFAHLHDPEGNSIELWEPSGTDSVRPPDQKKPNQGSSQNSKIDGRSNDPFGLDPGVTPTSIGSALFQTICRLFRKR